MDAALTSPTRHPSRWALAETAFAPVLPQLIGSLFSILYNLRIIIPLLTTEALRQRFSETVFWYNIWIYPVAVWLWVQHVYSLRPAFDALSQGEKLPTAELQRAQRRVVNLPWRGVLISALSWLGCIPVFLLALASVGDPLSPMLLWHFPISIIISTLIASTHSIFCIEAISYRRLFPIFFRDHNATTTAGRLTLSIRERGLLWALSIGICPIASLLLLHYAPPIGNNLHIFATIVGIAGTALGIFTALLMSNLVARPIDELKSAARDVAEGKLDRRISAARPDEFGQLLAAFDHMVDQLREKERIRQSFGLHVGRAAAERILSRDPELNGIEQTITVMFVDIRGFTARSASASAPAVVGELNEFLHAMILVVEERNGGMINKFLGDGFMAIFGAGGDEEHAETAVKCGKDMLTELTQLNHRVQADGRAPFTIGIGIHTGPAVVGSIGSPQRLEFTAIGNVVNVAARVEQLTKELGVSLLLTEATAAGLPRSEKLLALELTEIRGVATPVPLYTTADRA